MGPEPCSLGRRSKADWLDNSQGGLVDVRWVGWEGTRPEAGLLGSRSEPGLPDSRPEAGLLSSHPASDSLGTELGLLSARLGSGLVNSPLGSGLLDRHPASAEHVYFLAFDSSDNLAFDSLDSLVSAAHLRQEGSDLWDSPESDLSGTHVHPLERHAAQQV